MGRSTPLAAPQRKPSTRGIVLGALAGLALAAIALCAVFLLAERARRNGATEPAPQPRVVAAQPKEAPAPMPSESSMEPAVAPESEAIANQEAYAGLRERFREIAAGSGGRMSISLYHPGRDVYVSVGGLVERPSASVIKLCILVSALGRVQGGGAKLDSKIGSSTLGELLESMVTESDNAATNALIDAMGLEQLDSEIHSYLKLSEHTRLQRRMLDEEARAQGLDNTFTTDDIARLLMGLKSFQYLPLRDNEPLDKSLTAYACGLLRKQKNRTKIPSGLPAEEGLVVGNKTGELPGIENDAAIIDDSDGSWWVLVAGVDGASSSDQAKAAIAEAARASWEALRAQRPASPQ